MSHLKVFKFFKNVNSIKHTCVHETPVCEVSFIFQVRKLVYKEMTCSGSHCRSRWGQARNPRLPMVCPVLFVQQF